MHRFTAFKNYLKKDIGYLSIWIEKSKIWHTAATRITA